MKTIQPNISDDVGFAYFMALLWVLGLMIAVGVAYIGHQRTKTRYPTGRTRRVGFEIEAIDPSHDLNRSMVAKWLHRKHGIDVKDMGYTHEVMSSTKIVSDGSLSGGVGMEIVSPPLHEHEVRSYLSKLLKSLKGVLKVNSTTGLHHHIEIADPSRSYPREDRSHIGRIGLAYGYFQEAINKFLASSRINNTYARPMTYLWQAYRGKLNSSAGLEKGMYYNPYEDTYHATKHQLLKSDWLWNVMHDHEYLSGDTRYQAVNPTSYRKYGTLEFRQHQGTTNPIKIEAWSQILMLLVERCHDVQAFDTITDYKRDNITSFFRWLGLSSFSPQTKYFNKRAKLLREGVLTNAEKCRTCNSQHCAGDCFGEVSYTPRQVANYIHNGYYDEIEVLEDDADDFGGMTLDDDDYHFSAIGTLGLSVLFGLSPIVFAIALIVGCGIGAIHNAGNKSFKHKNRLRSLWDNLAQRGRQASGIAWLDGNGKMWFIKAPQSSKALSHNIRSQLDDDTQVAILHTRFATHGANNKTNAHPHWSSCNTICLVHNGVVHNYNKVWQAMNREPTGDVDSMAVAEALAVGGVEEVVKHCEGSMSLIWLDGKNKGELNFWTNGGNPLAFGRLDHSTKGAVVVASTMEILKSSMGKRLKASYECVVGRHYTVKTDGTIVSHDIKGSKETATYYYDWSTYNRNYTTRYHYSKPLKATGNADNCALPVKTTGSKTKTLSLDEIGEIPNDDIIELWTNQMRQRSNIYDWSPFKSVVHKGVTYHGYDGWTNEGIRPDNTTYSCPTLVQYEHLSSPVLERLLCGEYDPMTNETNDKWTYNDWDDWVDSWA